MAKRWSKSSDLKSGEQTLEYPRELYRCKTVLFLHAGLLDVFRCVYVQYSARLSAWIYNICSPLDRNTISVCAGPPDRKCVNQGAGGREWVLGIRHVLSKLPSIRFYSVWQVKRLLREVSCKNSSKNDLTTIFCCFLSKQSCSLVSVGRGMQQTILCICFTHSSQHDANNEPSEGPDADEGGGTAAGDPGQSPHRTQEDGQKPCLQQLTLPTWTNS